MVWVVVINDVRWTWVHTRMNPHSIIRDLEPLQCQRPSPYLIQEADPPTLPQPYYWVQRYPFFIHQDRIMGCGKMNRYATGVTTRPPQQSHTRQIDVIRQRPWVIFLHKYFSSFVFLFFILVSGRSRDHLFFIGHPNKFQSAASIVLTGLGQAGNFQTRAQGRLFWGPREWVWETMWGWSE